MLWPSTQTLYELVTHSSPVDEERLRDETKESLDGRLRVLLLGEGGVNVLVLLDVLY